MKRFAGARAAVRSLSSLASLAALVALPALLACGPRSIADAEKKGDVPWLDKRGTPDAMAALGRLADKDPRAVAAIDKRGDYDRDAYAAAWEAVLRGAPWGAQMYKAALANPARAELAASTMPRKDAHLATFVPDLEAAITRLGASSNNASVGAVLASAGAPAHDAIGRRLADPVSRGAMCRGVASSDATPDARLAMMQAPADSRDNPVCVDSISKMAAEDAAVLKWLGESAEPGLLSVACKNEQMTCARLHDAWARALATRPQERALVVPLKTSITRCPEAIDGVLADAIAKTPASQAVIVDAIDPDAISTPLRATCAALPAVLRGGAPAITRERAARALEHTCKKR